MICAAGRTQDRAASDAPPEALARGLDESGRTRVGAALERARECYADRCLGTGEPAWAHALGMAQAVVALNLDADARCAALLFAVPVWEPEALPAIEAQFGATVAGLVGGLARLNRLRVVLRESAAAGKAGARASQIEVLRKMLLAMVEDVRVVLLRLASRAQSLRYLTRAAGATRRDIARETLDIYAPLANRLGIWQLKWELEDLSLRFLEPALYQRIAAKLDQKRAEREAFIARAMERLRAALDAAGIRAEVTGRPKHIYSIYGKMRSKGLDFEEIRDVLALRVLVGEVKDCYAALGVVHDLWPSIPEAFDDYIARPKANLYRSLHTAVLGPDGRAMEVQIRTREMHEFAELGVAAHWRYKEAGAGGAAPAAARSRGAAFDEKIAVLRQMLAWRDQIVDASDWIQQFKQAALDDTVYVLTPQGQVLDLPSGATPVDFAYAVHTGLGHRCRGARVNGAIVPLDYRLKNGDTVEIVATRSGAASAGPSRDWLNPALGYLATSRARNKVRQWFNSLELGKTIAAGRATVEKELAREGRGAVNLEQLAAALGYARADELFAAAGREEIGARQIQAAIRGERHGAGARTEQAPPAAPGKAPVPAQRPVASSGAILVVGVDRLLTQLARCCKPLPPDEIRGFVTRGRGVSVHRSGCANLARLAERFPDRVLCAQWGRTARSQGAFSADIAVRGENRPGLLREVSDLLTRERVRVLATQSYLRDEQAILFLTLEVGSLEDLRRVLPLIAALKDVASVSRR